MSRKFYLLGLVILTLFFGYSYSLADYIPSTVDTMKVGGGTYANDVIYADPGDFKVPVTLYLRNTFDVAGFVSHLVYDTTVMYPRTPVPESTYYQPFRSQNLPVFAGSFDIAGEIYFTGSAFFNPTEEYIAEGRGAIVEFYFNIKSTAPEGCYSIRLEEDGVDPPDNYITDKFGTADYIPVIVNGTICIGDTSPPANNPPVIPSIASQTVIVGETLSFQVSATDQDGDVITLSAQNLPSNSTFPQVQGTGSVSGTFTFIPTAQQAPDTFTVTFIATDEHSAQAQRSVTIFLYEEEAPPQQPTDKIKMLSTAGGVPGARGRLIPVYFSNQEDTVYGIEFSMNYDPQAIIIDSLVPADRIEGFSVYSNLGDSLGKLTVLIFGLGNEMILPGSEDVLYLAVSVDTLASFGDSPLDLKSGWEAISIDPDEPARALSLVDGVFAVDKFGDVNLDKNVNVSDAVVLIAYILGKVSLNTRNWEAADINRDAGVNVGDLVGVINTILGRSINAPLQRPSEPLAYLHLEYDSLQPGSSGQIDVWADLKTSIAGMQLKIKYNPAQISFLSPEQTILDTLLYVNDEKNGILTLLSFRLGGSPIPIGKGSILSLPIVTSPDFDKENLKIEIEEAILVDPEAVVIPVDKGEIVLPKVFSLSQNYPNPFNPNTTIRFEIGSGGGAQGAVNTTLKIYNLLGQLVKTLVDEPKLPGIYYQTWDGRNGQGEKVSSGVYFYQLRVGDFNQTKKMVLMK